MEGLVTIKPTDSPSVDCMVLDGAAVVQILNTGNSRTFNDYALNIFLPYIKSQLKYVQRLDLVWDEYLPDSLKTATRVKRGVGIRRRVVTSAVLPKQWQDFLRVDDNKRVICFFCQNLLRIISMTVPSN